MTGWALLRFVKFVSVALLTAAVLGGVFGRDPAIRRRLSQHVGTVAMIGVLVAGYGLAKKTGASIGAPWISRALLCGLVAYGASCWGGIAPRVGSVTVVVAIAGLASAFGWMSARDLPHAWVLGVATPAVLAIPAALWNRRSDEREGEREDANRPAATLRWFAWLARAEGVSLLLLFGLYVPLKHAAGINLDGGQGWFGWMHGVMQLTFLVALMVTARVHGWSLGRQAVGFIASLVPFGTFWFERRVRG